MPMIFWNTNLANRTNGREKPGGALNYSFSREHGFCGCRCFLGTRILLILLMWWRVSLLVALLRLHFVVPREISVAPQLWGNCTTAVRQLHHNCGAVAPQLWGNENNAGKNKNVGCGNFYSGPTNGRCLRNLI